jgi:hypothetical protein
MDAWEVVDRPTNAQVLPSTFTYRLKTDEHGRVTRKKARFVVCGNHQTATTENVYSPTLKLSSLRLLLMLAALFGVIIQQLDIKLAFLNSIIQAIVYCEQPRGHEVGNRKSKVLRLKRSLYGLRTSPKSWSDTYDTVLKKLGFTRIPSEPCLYVRVINNVVTILGSFVDDTLYFSTDPTVAIQLKKDIQKHFDISDIGQASWCLGMQVQQTDIAISIDQKPYIRDLAQSYSAELRTLRGKTHVPAPTSVKLRSSTATDELTDNTAYRRLIGSLMYIAVATRPDIMHAISILSRYLTMPSKDHWRAGLRVLAYLSNTADLGIHYRKDNLRSMNDIDSSALVGYADADFGNDIDSSRSMTGYVFTINGSALSWKSKRQSIVATSTCEAEYAAGATAAMELKWLRSLFQDLGIKTNRPTILYVDNESAIFLANNNACTERSKHFRRRYHVIREFIQDGDILLNKIPGTDNPSDVLTKAVGLPILRQFYNRVGLRPVKE